MSAFDIITIILVTALLVSVVDLIRLHRKMRALERQLNAQEATERVPEVAASVGPREMTQDEAFMTKLNAVMEQQMANNALTVDQLVEEMNMGRTAFFTKLKSQTGMSPVEFIRERRIERAALLLNERRFNITEVTYKVGMNDSRYFARCFKNTYGMTPTEYRKRLGIGGLVMSAFVVLLMAGCVQQAPQRPSQRMGSAPEVDSASLALMELNKQLAISADQQLLTFAQAQEESYALYDANTWITFLDRGEEDGPSPARDEEWVMRMRTRNLNGQLLMDSEAAYRIGRQELPQAVEANMNEWRHGTHARLLAPWYAAYGLQGTEQIPPYENVIIELEIR